MRRQCISMICTCGRHRCHGLVKHKQQSWAQGSSAPFPDSEYKTEYRQKPVVPTKAATAQSGNIQLPTEPFDDETIYRSSYIPYKMDNRTMAIKPLHLRQSYLPPSVPMDGDSIYKTDYVRKQNEMVKSCKPNVQFQSPTERFIDDTTHREAFKAIDPALFPLCRLPVSKVKDGLKLPCSRFEGMTETKDRFRRYPFLERMPSFRPKQSGLEMFKGSGDYVPDLSSMYHSDYIPLPLQPRHDYRPTTKYTESGPFAGETTYKVDYKGFAGNRQPSCKPNVNYVPSKYDPMDESITKSDYRRWPNMPRITPAWARKDTYQPTSHPLESDTIYRDSYKRHMLEPRQAYQGKAATWRHTDADAALDAETEYKLRYKRWMLCPREKISKVSDYRPPCHKFEGESTTKTDYRGFSVPPPKSFRPKVNEISLGDNLPMDASTTYHDDYIKYNIECCPAAGLRGGPDPNGRFVPLGETDGHWYYEPMDAANERHGMNDSDECIEQRDSVECC